MPAPDKELNLSTVISADNRVIINNHAMQSHDIDETMDLVGHHLWPHRMKVAQAHSTVNSYVLGHLLGDFSVLDLAYGAAVEIKPDAAPDFYLVHIPVSGYAELHYGNKKSVSTPDRISISSPSMLSYVYMDQASRHLNLRIERSKLEDHLRNLIGHEIYTPLIFEMETPSQSSAGSALIQTLNSIFMQAKTVPEMFAHQQIIDQYKNLLMSILLSMFQHSYSDLLLNGKHNPVPWHVRQAKNYIEENLADYIGLGELAEFVGVSARTLQNGFRQFEGVSPAEYIRSRRLQRLHQALLAADPALRITDIMLEQGITSFGRYAHYYQERYRCLPSETLKK